MYKQQSETASVAPKSTKSSNKHKKKTKKATSKFSYPASSPTTLKYSKSANTPRTKKMVKKSDASWIKQNKSQKHDPAAPQVFSRQASILKLKQIATVAKAKKKPKKKTLIDIIYESDEEDEELSHTADEDVDSDTLMPPVLDRRFGLSADTGMNELLSKRNKELKEASGDSLWIKPKKKKKTNHTKAELSLLFDFRLAHISIHVISHCVHVLMLTFDQRL